MTISCVIPNDVPKRASEVQPDLQDRYAMLGQVEYHFTRSSTLRFDGNEYSTKTYFRKEGNEGYHGRYFASLLSRVGRVSSSY